MRVLVDKFGTESGRIRFEGGNTCRKGNGCDFAGHIKLFERIEG